MDIKDIIRKKRDGFPLTFDEINFFVKSYVAEDIPDYQISALLMAIYFSGMNEEETMELTEVMKTSGDIVDLSMVSGIKVDKHSTGGVGDKTTLIVGPIAAACGVTVAKMSGRGLGFTGGTIDKLESIPGFRTTLPPEKFIHQLENIGIAIIGQSKNITPADKKLYALRDVTETVDSMPLIASSIMSKKLATGSDGILLDVKCGNGAFMHDIDKAKKLAELMIKIGKANDKNIIAMITDMNQPLGKAVGNSLEVKEAIEVLRGDGPSDITELSLALSGAMIYIGGRAKTFEEGINVAKEALRNGAGLNKFREIIKWQGGDPDVCSNPDKLPSANIKLEIKAESEGYIHELAANTIGQASEMAGAGRSRKEDDIDLSAGIYLDKKIGDYVSQGDVIGRVYGNNEEKVNSAVKMASSAFKVSKEKPKPVTLIKEVIK